MASTVYNLSSVKMPRLAGGMLNLFTALLSSPATNWMFRNSLLESAGIMYFRKIIVDEAPTPQPFAPFDGALADITSRDPATLRDFPPTPQHGFAFATVRDYAEAYRAGATTPTQVAEKALAAIDDSNQRTPALRAIIKCNRDDLLAQARSATERFRAGKPLSIFDGVPVAVKDEIDQTPYGTSVGTKFLGTMPAARDATVVARMRAAGALMIGKTNMHEIGIGVTGLNPHYGCARNPYNVDHFTGGSSSGSAAAVAAGLCPVAIGADGGGSIRIPSAFCGVVGLKSTYGRVSEMGAAPLCWSVAHLGPLAATAEDAALAWAIMAGPDVHDTNTLRQPSPTLDGFELDVQGMTFGIYPPWFNHATPALVAVCEKMVKGFEQRGGRIVEIEIPELNEARIAHVVTITTEMMAAMERYYAKHRRDFGLDVQTNLALARAFTALDYVQAQRVRTRAMANFNRVLADVDAILTPTTGVTAPSIPLDALPNGESDLTTLTEIMRFVTPGNLTGLPAISFPAGYDAEGLPVGMQAIGRAWQETELLRIARVAGDIIERRAPQVHYALLGK